MNIDAWDDEVWAHAVEDSEHLSKIVDEMVAAARLRDIGAFTEAIAHLDNHTDDIDAMGSCAMREYVRVNPEAVKERIMKNAPEPIRDLLSGILDVISTKGTVIPMDGGIAVSLDAGATDDEIAETMHKLETLANGGIVKVDNDDDLPGFYL